MLLERVVERNPALIEAAVRLHQSGAIPPNTWLYDLDVVAYNARALARGAREHGLTTYIMTKQYARNPMVSMTAISQGMHKTVAVDIHGAKMMHRYGVPVGHIGHLNQIPRFDVARALDIGPEVITVYSVEAARRTSEAAVQKGVTQDLLVRVYRPGDVFFPGQEGGFREQDVVDAVRQIQRLPAVEVVGVTSFPVVSYSYREPMHLNPNMDTILRAARALERELGVRIKQINAPANTSTQTFPMLQAAGATHVEPGTGLTGSSAGHVINGAAWVEKPAYVYVSEISHHWEGRAYAFAGGLRPLMDGGVGPGWPRAALVGSDPKQIFDNPLPYEHMWQIIDYHIPLEQGERARIGDTVVMAISTQVQMTRSHTAAVSGTSTGDLKVWGIFDHASTQLDSDYNPVPPAEVKQQIRELVDLYAPAASVR